MSLNSIWSKICRHPPTEVKKLTKFLTEMATVESFQSEASGNSRLAQMSAIG